MRGERVRGAGSMIAATTGHKILTPDRTTTIFASDFGLALVVMRQDALLENALKSSRAASRIRLPAG